jgi:hypothetical protein
VRPADHPAPTARGAAEIRSVPNQTLIGYIDVAVVVASAVNARSGQWQTSIEFIGQGEAPG